MKYCSIFQIDLYFRDSEGKEKDVTLLDLQLMKYTRPTVDLAYFFGSSSSAAFRKEHLKSLLEIYHKKLCQELEIFGYSQVYSLEQLHADFEDTWAFGFVISCLHVQVRLKISTYFSVEQV